MEDVSAMKVADLKKELRARGLAITGNKNELVERLQAALSEDRGSEVGSTADKDDCSLIAEASALLNDDEPAESTPADESVGNDAVAETADSQKKKVSIKRDTALPAVGSPTSQTSQIIADKASKSGTETAAVQEQANNAITANSTESNGLSKAGNRSTDEQSATPASAEKPAQLNDSEKAKLRAERFGVTSPASGGGGGDAEAKKAARAARFGLAAGGTTTPQGSTADLGTLKKRAERFGQTTSKSIKEMEMQEKIKKRQERFGAASSPDSSAAETPEAKKVKVEVNKDLLVDEKLKQRAKRFGTEVVA